MSSVLKLESSDEGTPPLPVYDLLRLRPIGIDDWSAVRYVHDTSFRTIVRPHVALHVDDAFTTLLDGPDYVDQLRGCDLIGAWLGGELVGTAGWRPVGDDGQVAEIEALFVQPMFTFMGIGTTLLTDVENRARRSGCTAFMTMATPASAPFFERLGYRIAEPSGIAAGSDTPVLVMRKVHRDDQKGALLGFVPRQRVLLNDE